MSKHKLRKSSRPEAKGSGKSWITIAVILLILAALVLKRVFS
jgi:hypothetical protein